MFPVQSDANTASPVRDIAALHRLVLSKLRRGNVPGAEQDARDIVAHLCAVPPAMIYTAPGCPVDGQAAAQAQAYCDERCAGVPLYRIFGRKPFWTLDLRIGPRVFEPRADSETLIYAVLDWLGQRGAANGPVRFADICTGSGAIGLSLLRELPKAQAVLSDIDEAALVCACKNAEMSYTGKRVMLARTSFCEGIGNNLDFITANPPYIPSGDIRALDEAVWKYDPQIALDGGIDGCEAFRAIIGDVRRCLSTGGALFLEIGHDQAHIVTSLLKAGGFGRVIVRKDLAGHDRVVIAS